MRLVDSSTPGAADAFAVRYALEQRVLLTRSLVEALRESDGDYAALRAKVALDALRAWERAHPDVAGSRDDADDVVVPDGYEDVVAECRSGARIAHDLFFVWTADTRSELESDLRHVGERLAQHRW